MTGVAYSITNPAATAYQWLVTGGTMASGQGTPAITVDWGTANANGAPYLKVFRFNAQGCSSDTTTLNVVINQRLQTVKPTGPGDIVAVAPLPRAVCQADGPYTYTSGVFAAGSSFSWTIVGGTQVASSRNTVSVAWNPVTVPTIGKIVATETSNPSGGVCRGTSDTLYVNINPSPRGNLAISAPARVCAGSGPVTFGLPGGFAGSSYVFKLDGTTLAGTGSTRTLATLPIARHLHPHGAGNHRRPRRLRGPALHHAVCGGPAARGPHPDFGLGLRVQRGHAAAIRHQQPHGRRQLPVDHHGRHGDCRRHQPAGNGALRQHRPLRGECRGNQRRAQPVRRPGHHPHPHLLDNPTLALTNVSVDATSNARVIVTLSAPNSASTPNPVRILRRVAGTTGALRAGGHGGRHGHDLHRQQRRRCQPELLRVPARPHQRLRHALLPTPTAQTIRLVATPAAGAGGRDQGSVSLAWNAYVGFAVKEYRIYRQHRGRHPGAAENGGPERAHRHRVEHRPQHPGRRPGLRASASAWWP